ncbi:hypothetical protein JHK84_051014 [Glycine max]|nr:hypothetical protein JHK84_051014 [Glycine max]
MAHDKDVVYFDLASPSYTPSEANLKFKTNKSTKLVSWNSSIDFCEWRGVACDEDGQVTGLDLSGESIYGGFDNSSTLFSLQNLQILNLSANNFSSEIPSGFNKLKNLTYLNLSHAGFVGQIPTEISYLARLVATLSVLDLSFNYHLYGSLPEFPVNSPLQTLIVSGTNFSGAIPPSINNLGQLSILDLSNCHFNGTLPSSMSRFRELTYLDLSLNDFTGQIPSLNMSNNLTHLDFTRNGFTGSITYHFGGLRNLLQIDLQDNFLDGSLPSSLFSLPLLRSIRLSNNNFQDQLNKYSNISSSKLEVLDLSGNDLNGSIPTDIFQLRSLSVLELSSNKLNGTLKLDVIHRLENLTTLGLSHNHLSIDTNFADVGLISSIPNMNIVELASCNLTEFPSFLRNQSKITILDLSSNNIQGSIPTWIWQLNSLVQLNLSHNLLSNLEGPVQNSSSNLSLLDLHDNHLQGKLQIFPVHATYLDYSSNNFSFTIPSDIGNFLSSTIFLSLSKNNLSGNIPQSLCSSSVSLVLDFSYNHLNGKIPECLTQNGRLVVLNLQHNKFHGSIPDKFPVSCALSTLDLNSNLLRGSIPKSLASCTSLEVLDLGNNQVDDGFPCFLKTISTLRVMVLRGNKFHGHIGCPHANSTWHVLQIVDLAFNNFSGVLPGKWLKTWKAMMLDEDDDGSQFNYIRSQVLKFGGIYYQDSVTLTSKGLRMEFVKILTVLTSVDFSSNNFEGTIPEELMNFTRLHLLNLSDNALAGHIPSSIGNLKQLESLDLSSNHFDGEIPTQLANLNFLSYLNVSSNRLVGKIPVGNQLQTFDASSFVGNAELCGAPLIKNCSNETYGLPTSPHARPCTFGWNIMRIELGFVFGLALVIGPLLFWKQWRQWYWKRVDLILCRIFPQLNLEYESSGGHCYQVLRWRH